MTEADKDIAAAWRAANRDEPPQALDDTIRAAARREVGAGPRRAGGTPAWWPLAAAATVAVLAIGIVQMTPTERVSPEMTADVRPAPTANQAKTTEPPVQRSAESDRNAPGSALAEKPAKLQAPASALRKETPARAPIEEQRLAASRGLTDTARTASAEPERGKPAERELRQKSELANATPAAVAPGSADPSSATHSVPFPAASPPRDKLDAQAQAAAGAPPGTPESRPAPALASPSQPAPPPSAPSAGALAPNAPAPVERRMAMAKTAAGEIKREADAQSRPVDEWIKLMRRLIAEGKPAEAAKELAAFRAAYKERADALLPSDLREFKPQ